jgi:hypothetical protein
MLIHSFIRQVIQLENVHIIFTYVGYHKEPTVGLMYIDYQFHEEFNCNLYLGHPILS